MAKRIKIFPMGLIIGIGITALAFANPRTTTALIGIDPPKDVTNPIIEGAVNNEIYDSEVTIKITDKNLSSVKVNGIVKGKLSVDKEKNKYITFTITDVGVYKVVGIDESGNTTVIKFYITNVPYNTLYKRPLTSGYITFDYTVEKHAGIDFRAALGTSVYPIANGVVTFILGENDRVTCGGLKLTIIYNINGEYYSSVYMHLSKVVVEVGDIVNVDQVVAYTGNSGYCSTGPHLHFAFTHKARKATEKLYGIPKDQTYSSEKAYQENVFDQDEMFKLGSEGSTYTSRDI